MSIKAVHLILEPGNNVLEVLWSKLASIKPPKNLISDADRALQLQGALSSRIDAKGFDSIQKEEHQMNANNSENLYGRLSGGQNWRAFFATTETAKYTVLVVYKE